MILVFHVFILAFQKLVLKKLAKFELELIDIKKLLLAGGQDLDLDEIPKLPVSTIDEYSALCLWADSGDNRNTIVTSLFS
jgi:hypothetical protein